VNRVFARRNAAMSFIFVTVALDMLGLGVISDPRTAQTLYYSSDITYAK